ncbi:hypothetical protein [Streptomyces lydicus]
MPPVPEPYQLPFHYGALHHIGIDYLVDPGPPAMSSPNIIRTWP